MLRQFAGIALFCVAGISHAATESYQYKVIKVIDGDTVQIQAPFLPPPLKPVLSLRVMGVDTPEKPPLAKCLKEAKLSDDATFNARTLISSAKEIKIEISDWDKYGGRVLGNIWLDGKSLAELQIAGGYGRIYNGGKKSNWCN